ncbi:MAG TPA: hypothetical protein VJP76_04780 [Candidatus Tumulicola sp.]|nr:hypothetical protein [Candidatus Tumulicola sp.]
MKRVRSWSMVAVAACASLAVAFGAWSAVRAGTLPNISGTWYGNGHSSRRCQIRQSGDSVSLTNEQGSSASGTFTDPSTLSTSWGVFGGGTVTGHISGDLRTITWSNGTYWTRSPDTAPPAPVPAATPTPVPYWYMAWSEPEGPHAPIELARTWTAVMRNGSAAYSCVSFKNTSDRVANQVRFEFELLNHNRHVVDTAHLDRKGTFSPDISIHGYYSLSDWGQGNRGFRDNCIGWQPDDQQQRLHYARLRYFSVRVTRIEYADGTTWPSL